MLRIVVDTNIWIRTPSWGTSLPILLALREKKYGLVVSAPLLEELKEVTQRPRLKKRIDAFDVSELLDLLEWQGELVELHTIPPRCRDPKIILFWQQRLMEKPTPL
ncbi:MAG: putative toxin-antitoxin system toxin component, PIN family [Chloroflexi bacterium]|nr:putative toxin-antitoxin system toxin component, PIN family [Chloroflexota bacterium]